MERRFNCSTAVSVSEVSLRDQRAAPFRPGSASTAWGLFDHFEDNDSWSGVSFARLLPTKTDGLWATRRRGLVQ